MTNMKIEILSKQIIKPSSSTPNHLREFKLSFIDERIPHSYMPLVIYYSFNETSNIKQSEISDRLKSSLSDALVHYYPFAGRTLGQSSIECNDEGILYIEANADGKIWDVMRSMDSDGLEKLIPFKSNGCVSDGVEQLAVQATSFSCGGIAIGINISHRIADFCTLDSFIKCWTSIARGDLTNIISPVFNSSTLFPPHNTPDFKPNVQSPSVRPLATKPVMKRFVFTSSALDKLKSQAKQNSSTLKPTRVEVLTAFLWNRCHQAKGINKFAKSVAYHPIDLRGRISELTEHSFGNIFQMARAENDGEITEWVHLVEKVRNAFKKMDSEYIKRMLDEKGYEVARENFMEISKFLSLGNIDTFRFTSYGKFGFYEADFGWGKPVWVSNASYVGKDIVFLVNSIEWTGGIEAWITMDAQDMARLEEDIEIKNLTLSSFVC